MGIIQDYFNDKYQEKNFVCGEDTEECHIGIDELDLSVRTYNTLKRASINTVEELTLLTPEELKNVRNLSRSSYEEVMEKLKELNLRLSPSDDAESSLEIPEDENNLDDQYFVSTIGRHRMGTDGKGIRSLVVTSGCPLKCKYCVNPYTWDGSNEPMRLTAEEVWERIKIDRLYILATGGGITFGGGEPLLQPDLIRQVSELCDSEMSIIVQTSLNVPWENIQKVLDCVDEFYVDVKTLYPETYYNYTGQSMYPMLKNLKKLVKTVGTGDILVRIPIIPNYTDQKMQQKTKEALEEIGITRFDLFEYKMFDELKDNKNVADV